MPKEAQSADINLNTNNLKTLENTTVSKEETLETMKLTKKTVVFVYAVVVVLGVGTGYLLYSSVQKRTGLSGSPTKVTMTKSDKAEGVNDTTVFKDSAEGVIEKGGTDGEGTHKLIREGGPSQTAALVSSVLDLDEYIGKKVKVWGQTYPPQKAGWFMDVGKIELRQ